MAITFVPMICPQCGAQLEVPTNKDYCYCVHCGTQLLINDDSVKTINVNHRVTDEARIAETNAKAAQGKQEFLVATLCIVAILAMLLLMALPLLVRH